MRTNPAILDVRAPVEYHRGHLPNSFNQPILNDDERAAVGTQYKQAGAAAATQLGHDLVSGTTRETRIKTWQAHIDAHNIQYLMCWRGGQRSRIAQDWLRAAGYSVQRIAGGYKAMRQACLKVLEDATRQPHGWLVLAGQTGTGKTELLKQQPQNAIDLEGLANHRGSAFGSRPEGQPELATFENALAASYLKIDVALQSRPLLLEDESRTIGRMAVPESWHQRMQASPLVLVQASLEERISHIKSEYVDEALLSQPAAALAERYLAATQRISRRLGGLRSKELQQLIQAAFANQADHEAWIAYLLCEYYDPMYNYQLEKK
ncbi:MAG: tRNA 2-selenouridine(34) synthase MnmH, partial [Pseudomonadota bacterium]